MPPPNEFVHPDVWGEPRLAAAVTKLAVGDLVWVLKGVHSGSCARVIEVCNDGLLKIDIDHTGRPYWVIARDYVTEKDIITGLGDLVRE